jgi:hypothetical protein
MSPDVYSLAGLRLTSDVPLAPLPVVGGEPEWEVEVLRGRRPAARWFHRWYEPGGRLALSFGRSTDGVLLQFARSAAFEVDTGARRIRCFQPAGLPRETLRHLLLNQVLPMVLASVDRLVLHASAVAGPDGVVAFVGPAGSGKSTTAAALVCRGWELVSDDMLIVERSGPACLAVPTFCEVRLRPDAARTLFSDDTPRTRGRAPAKMRFGSPAGLRLMREPRAIARIILLGGSRRRHAHAGATLTPVTAREALVNLVQCSIQLDIADRAARRALLHQTATLVERTEVVRAAFPRSLSALNALLQAAVAGLETARAHGGRAPRS